MMPSAEITRLTWPWYLFIGIALALSVPLGMLQEKLIGWLAEKTDGYDTRNPF